MIKKMNIFKKYKNYHYPIIQIKVRKLAQN